LTSSCPRTGWIQQKKNKIAINFFPYNKSFALILNVAGRMLTFIKHNFVIGQEEKAQLGTLGAHLG
jgi:hypothetical protein